VIPPSEDLLPRFVETRRRVVEVGATTFARGDGAAAGVDGAFAFAYPLVDVPVTAFLVRQIKGPYANGNQTKALSHDGG
jgi:hypothetical protein